jgi:hypothetical protein
MIEGLEPRKGDQMPTKHSDMMEDSNRSANPTIHDVSDPGRRIVLRGALGAALAALYAPFFGGCAGGSESARPQRPRGRRSASRASRRISRDRLVVPEGYMAVAIAAWGEPVGIPGNMPAFKFDASKPPPSRRCRWACTTTACTTTRSRAAARMASFA